jgi:hypothetical protein
LFTLIIIDNAIDEALWLFNRRRKNEVS